MNSCRWCSFNHYLSTEGEWQCMNMRSPLYAESVEWDDRCSLFRRREREDHKVDMNVKFRVGANHEN